MRLDDDDDLDLALSQLGNPAGAAPLTPPAELLAQAAQITPVGLTGGKLAGTLVATTTAGFLGGALLVAALWHYGSATPDNQTPDTPQTQAPSVAPPMAPPSVPPTVPSVSPLVPPSVPPMAAPIVRPEATEISGPRLISKAKPSQAQEQAAETIAETPVLRQDPLLEDAAVAPPAQQARAQELQPPEAPSSPASKKKERLRPEKEDTALAQRAETGPSSNRINIDLGLSTLQAPMGDPVSVGGQLQAEVEHSFMKAHLFQPNFRAGLALSPHSGPMPEDLWVKAELGLGLSFEQLHLGAGWGLANQPKVLLGTPEEKPPEMDNMQHPLPPIAWTTGPALHLRLGLETGIQLDTRLGLELALADTADQGTTPPRRPATQLAIGVSLPLGGSKKNN